LAASSAGSVGGWAAASPLGWHANFSFSKKEKNSLKENIDPAIFNRVISYKTFYESVSCLQPFSLAPFPRVKGKA
jgi:hypothetical protein